ncbi:hypothetical protein [Caballeronia sp. DA-9]|uniref:hypothetical protein n=1 Tax=Caballeronia sp. DA-9 TaxID=3436237 RepID=UPI003F66A104
MPAGLQCWDASGNLVVDITSRLPRFVGSAPVGPGNTSSITNANLALGTVWYAFQPQQIWGFQNMDVSRPIFSVSGSTISWTYSAGATTRNMQIIGTVFFGVY